MARRRQKVTKNSRRKPCPSGGDEADKPFTPDINKWPGVVLCDKPTRVNSQSEDMGSLPADTDGSTPTFGNPGGEYVVEIRSPSLQYPYPSLETVGNDCANEGVTAQQHMPRSRLHSALVGGVRSMARPVSVHVPTVDGCPVFGRLGSGGIGYGTSGYHVRTDAEYATPSVRGPTCSARTRYSPRAVRKLLSGADGTARRPTKGSSRFSAGRMSIRGLGS